MLFPRGIYLQGVAAWAGCPAGTLLLVTPGTRSQPNPAKALASDNPNGFNIQRLLQVSPSNATRGPHPFSGPKPEVVANTLRALRSGQSADPDVVLGILEQVRTQTFFLDPEDNTHTDPNSQMAISFDLPLDTEKDVMVWSETHGNTQTVFVAAA